MKDIVRFNILGRPVSSKSMRRSFHERSREAEKEFFKDTVKITKDQTYELAQERAEGIEVTEESLRSGDAVSLTLTDGHVVWLPAEDLPKLLDVKRGQPLEIGAGTKLKLHDEKRGALAIGIKFLRLLGFDLEEKASESLTDWISERVEQKVVNETKVCQCLFSESGTSCELKPVDQIAPEKPDQPVLVLLHGTASSTRGSFSHLWSTHGKLWKEVVKFYEGHVYALEHRTLTESPASNVCVLLDALAHRGQVVHLLSHSRGGIVGELLCRSMVEDGSAPISELEIKRTLKGYSSSQIADNEEKHAAEEKILLVKNDLTNLAQKLEDKSPRIERFVRVACPSRGTGLADERLDFFFNLLLWGVEKLAGQIKGDADVFEDLAASVRSIVMRTIKQRFDPRVLPGLECMVPGTPLQQFMNYSGRKLKGELAVISGDADVSRNPLQFIATALLNLHYREANDWVVETQSMTGGHARVDDIRVLPDKGGNVNHFSYFENKDTATSLMELLLGRAEQTDFTTRSVPEPILGLPRGEKASLHRPTVFFLPGFPGSHLRYKDKERVWLDLGVAAGDLRHLKIENDQDVIAPDGLVDYIFSDSPYGKFVDYLRKSFAVQPFPYDWRLDLKHNSNRFADCLETALNNNSTDHFPFHIVCHSMGGLIALHTILEHPDLWERICGHPDSRLILAGTPLRGTFNTVQLITGSHGLVKFAAGVDQCHTHEELIEIFRHFPGLLQSLPRWISTWNFFHADSWNSIREKDMRTFQWRVPESGNLESVLSLAEALDRTPKNTDRIHYVAGTDSETPSGIRFTSDNELRVTCLDQPDGDGLALWEQSIPDYAQAWCLPDVEHGSLFDRKKYFPLYADLLNTGTTSRIPQGTPVSRDVAPEKSRDLEDQPIWIQPDEDDLLRALIAGKKPPRDDDAQVISEVPEIRIFHGNLMETKAPVIVGHYEGDSINGTERALDKKIDGLLSKRNCSGDYPGMLETAEIFTSAKDPDNAAIVVGLGGMGMLSGPMLRRTYSNALIRFSLHRQEQARFAGIPETLPEVMSLIVGSGIGALPMQQAFNSILKAVVDANQRLRAMSAPTFSRLNFIELYEDSAIKAAHILESLIQDFDGLLDLDPVVHQRKGGLSARYRFHSDAWWRILRIERVNDSMVFLPVSERGALPTLTKVNQQHFVDSMVESAIDSPSEQSRLGKALFETLIPHNYKEDVSDQQGIQLLLDEYSARFPWEMLQDRDSRSEEPIAVQTGVVRQLIMPDAPSFRDFSRGDNALIIADTLGDLAGAREEGRQVGNLLLKFDYKVDSYIKQKSTDAAAQLLINDYRILHFATHGVCKKQEDDKHTTALVMGEDFLLLPETIASLRRVPELVFLNCCHLAHIKESDEEYMRGRHILAASISTAFLRLGARAVIAAGWAVDDDAAQYFAQVFYQSMLARGKSFGSAVTEARSKTYKKFPGSNTWSAYQCYGESSFRLAQSADKDPCPSPLRFHAPSEFAGWLRDFKERCRSKDTLGALKKRLRQASSAENEWIRDDPKIQEALGYIFSELGAFEEAARYYDKALNDDKGEISLKGVEQACNISTRWVEKTLKSDAELHSSEIEQIKSLFAIAIERLEGLNRISETAERNNLLASAFKHRAVVRYRLAEYSRIDCFDDLKKAREKYFEANDIKKSQSGKSDSYSLLNAITIDAVLRRIGSRRQKWKVEDLEAMLNELEEPLSTEPVDFWARTDRVNYKMVRALVRGRMTIEVANQLADQFIAEFTGATAREVDSVVKQIRVINELFEHYSQKKTLLIQAFQHLYETLKKKLF